MGMRQDSLTAASQMNMMIELEALRKQVVATVGNLRLQCVLLCGLAHGEPGVDDIG